MITSHYFRILQFLRFFPIVQMCAISRFFRIAISVVCLATVFLLSIFHGPQALAEKLGDEAVPLPAALSKIEQMRLLHTRVVSGVVEGNFGEFSEMLYSVGRPFMGSSSEKIAKTELMTVFPESYKPTYSEFFENIARQTQSTLKYDPSTACGWVFEPPAMPLPYTVKIAQGWKSENRGLYVSYVPKSHKLGLDIYMMGKYSGLDEEKLKGVRDAIAYRFAKLVDASADLDQMKEVTVDGANALYYETKPAKKPETVWRQWSLVKNAQAFIIVSSLDVANEGKLLPDVQAMVASFHVNQQVATTAAP